MGKFQYKGERTDVGRFGILDKGDIIELTPSEAKSVIESKDSRFEMFVPGVTKPLPQPIPAGLTIAQQDKWLAEEKERKTRLAHDTTEEKTATVALDDMSDAELFKLAEDLNTKGAKIAIGPATMRKGLKKEIKAALESGEFDLEEQEPTDEDVKAKRDKEKEKEEKADQKARDKEDKARDKENDEENGKTKTTQQTTAHTTAHTTTKKHY